MWACGLVGAVPREKKGADKGIDGDLYFHNSRLKKAIVQVKSGHVRPEHIRDLKGTIARENCQMGIFITLENPSKNMIEEAAASGFCKDVSIKQRFPKIQIITIEELLKGKTLTVPYLEPQHKKAKRYIEKDSDKQDKLF